MAEPARYEENIGDDLHQPAVPHDIESERSVLGIILRDNNRLDELDYHLSEEDFYIERHQLIFHHLQRLRGEGQAADVVTIGTALKDAGKLDKAGGHDYLLDLYSLGELHSNFAAYVHLVRDKSTLRRLGKETEEINNTLHNPGERSCANILEDAESRLFNLSDLYHNRRRDSVVKVGELTKDINTQITDLYDRYEKGESPLTGVSSGFSYLDMHTSGLQRSDLIILAARPSIGKTAFALDLIRNLCVRADEKEAVAMFSLEMSSNQIAMRLISALSSIDQYVLRSGRLKDPKSWSDFTKALATLEKWPMWIDESVNLTVGEIHGRARRMQRICERGDRKLSLVVVDYLQLIGSDDSNNQENRAVQVSNISRGLKNIARDLQVPVLALSQMSRRIEDRPGKRPQLSDLRDSGGIEQDADLIMFLSRDESGNPDGTGSSVPMELIIGKHRNGPVGTIKLKFDKRYTRFREEEGQQIYDPEADHASWDQGDQDDYVHTSS